MDDCDVLTLRTADQNMAYFMGTRSVVIAIFSYFQQHTQSKVINVAINPLKTIQFYLCHMAQAGKEEREVII